MKKMPALILFSILVFPGIAADPLKLTGSVKSPKYLVPIDPHTRKDEEAIEKLLGDRWGYGTMIYTDSTGRAFVVSVWGKDYANYDYEHPRQNFITLIEVSLTHEADSTHAIPTKEIEVPINVELAIAVQRAWAAMLLKTRYPTTPYLGLDGWRTEFSVGVRGAGAVYGQLWSPSDGLPKELMDLGFALADYCKAPQHERFDKRKQLLQWLQDFTKRLAG